MKIITQIKVAIVTGGASGIGLCHNRKICKQRNSYNYYWPQSAKFK